MSRRTRENKSAVRGQKGSGGRDMKRFYVVLAIVGVIAVAIVGYSIASSGSVGGMATEPVELEGMDDPARLIALARGVERGDPDAPLTILEFADFQCPACASFALQVKPMVDMSYVEDGQVRFVYYDFPLQQHRNSFLASRSARCAEEQDVFWEYHDVLYRDQSRWAASSNPVSIFVDHARGVGVDAGAFRSCVESDRHADVVTANMMLGQQLGVSGTPTLMLSQGRGMATRITSFDFESIQRAVEDALEP